MKTLRFLLGVVWVSGMLLACSMFEQTGPPSNAQPITVVANPSLTAWLTAAANDFNAAGVKTAQGRPAYVSLVFAESGQTIRNWDLSNLLPALWIPDSPVWVAALAEQGQAAFQTDCQSVAQSPLVIAMWRPLAESLGWPGRTLGWLDVGSLAADPSAWAYYSGGQFGDSLRLGHTHPGLAGTGANTLLAVVQAAQSKTTTPVTVEDIQQPIVGASVSAFESAVAWFSPNSDTLGQTMRTRGFTFLGAAVMYENTALQYSQGDANGQADIVPIYPFEGTFVATHPACVNTTADAASQEAAQLFRAYLLDTAAQQQAVAQGLRPVNNTVSVGAPLDAAHGVDLQQPAIIFPEPSVETLYAVQDLWQAARKQVNLVMLLDVSGSMDGDKLNSLRQAAAQFVAQMAEDDYLSLVTFSAEATVVVEHARVGDERQRLTSIITNLYAGGGTALFDAIGTGAEVVARTTDPNTTNVIIVLSDGQDTASTRFRFDDHLLTTATANTTTIFTIAYGSDADAQVLTNLAAQGQGNYYQGDVANLATIYEEMSVAFGGNVGVGR